MSQRPVCQLEFTRQELLWALRRQNHLRLRQTPGDPRAAIETTVRGVKHPFGGRLPVRGLRRITDMLLGAAVMANIRSIVRFHKRKQKQRPQPVEQGWQEAVKRILPGHWMTPWLPFYLLPLSSWVRQPILVTCFSC
ncbi:MAG: hypothetical protein IPL78_23605 [Chloroflexi bacterium]|nr:hypothetical protein [Chloroflexota bacterium]